MRDVIVVSLLALSFAGPFLPVMLRAQEQPPHAVSLSPLSTPFPQSASSDMPSANAEAAARMLDGLQGVFDAMSGPADESDFGHRLSVIADTGRDLLNARMITPAFHARCARVVLVVRLAIITDTGQILKPIVNREFVAFVREVTGKTYNPQAPASQQIAVFSDAVATELTKLREEAKRLR
jgi:hypothetical protein